MNPFAALELSPASHFAVNVHAAVYRVIVYARGLGALGGGDADELFARYPFLRGHLQTMAPYLPDGLGWEETVAWWPRALSEWEREAPAERPPPLVALARAGVLDLDDRMALLTAGLAEEDSRFAELLSDLQPGGARTAMLETLGRVVGVDHWALGRRLLDAGLVEAADPRVPRSQWVLRVPSGLWEAIRGFAAVAPEPGMELRWELPDARELVLAPGVAARVHELPAVLARERASTLVVRGMRGSDREEVVGAVARSLGVAVLRVDGETAADEASWRRVGPLCTALGALPMVVLDLAPGETATLASPPGYDGPLAAVLAGEGGVRGQAMLRSVTLELPPEGFDERLRLWEGALPAQPVEELAERFLLPAGHLRRVATEARAIAALERREQVGAADVRQACRSLNRQRLETLATHVEPAGTWESLVVSERTGARLLELERRCRHRERILERLAPSLRAGATRGVRALFTGASGTGKTMAARILAAELGMDLFRVDLAAVVNKYVGETEKNLHRILSTAEELDVLLLIDEGDALLGARTEVRSANDRFANLETNYLLQRLESYQGIVAVTTNAADRIDPAFSRRMDVVVSFVEPGPLERREIWALHLPEGHTADARRLDEISERCVLSGGQIRNAALSATLLALDRDGNVATTDVERAVSAEYGKAGAVSPLDRDGHAAPERGIEAFLEALS
ncbi:AAA family ATPase [Solirubrobacter ginsenosidimutans]|uniref:AAA family ATPase n=1 Tax=Solirubrobacter ginsenosidimutans TaxID=490573 RepID=A0A9X3S637_9ACTN|nr:ATP-binding protein [Solirubrobacter ginsenosidimutans]MDA0166262.1 AAA family ATPase [Solirubrobacter ginsenosidimutans]